MTECQNFSETSDLATSDNMNTYNKYIWQHKGIVCHTREKCLRDY